MIIHRRCSSRLNRDGKGMIMARFAGKSFAVSPLAQSSRHRRSLLVYNMAECIPFNIISSQKTFEPVTPSYIE